MLNKQYRAINVTNRKTEKIVKRLSDSGITSDSYRINHFSTQKEIVAEISISKKIKEILGE